MQGALPHLTLELSGLHIHILPLGHFDPQWLTMFFLQDKSFIEWDYKQAEENVSLHFHECES